MPQSRRAIRGCTSRTACRAATLLTVLLVAAPLLAGATTANTDAAAPATAITAAATPAPDDLGQALLAVVAEARIRLRELSAAAKAAPDPAQAAALRIEADAVHRDMKRRLLEVQLDFAQRKGDTALVAELSGILARLDRPAVAVPQDHPAPHSVPQPAPTAR